MTTRKSTIEFNSLELTVEYDYQPSEPQTREHPGAAEEIIINEIYWDEKEVLPLFESLDLVEEVIDAVCEHLRP